MNPKRMLAADDPAQLSRVIERLLRRARCAVAAARDGQEALEPILRQAPVAPVSMPAGDFANGRAAGSPCNG